MHFFESIVALHNSTNERVRKQAAKNERVRLKRQTAGLDITGAKPGG